MAKKRVKENIFNNKFAIIFIVLAVLIIGFFFLDKMTGNIISSSLNPRAKTSSFYKSTSIPQLSPSTSPTTSPDTAWMNTLGSVRYQLGYRTNDLNFDGIITIDDFLEGLAKLFGNNPLPACVPINPCSQGPWEDKVCKAEGSAGEKTLDAAKTNAIKSCTGSESEYYSSTNPILQNTMWECINRDQQIEYSKNSRKCKSFCVSVDCKLYSDTKEESCSLTSCYRSTRTWIKLNFGDPVMWGERVENCKVYPSEGPCHTFTDERFKQYSRGTDAIGYYCNAAGTYDIREYDCNL